MEGGTQPQLDFLSRKDAHPVFLNLTLLQTFLHNAQISPVETHYLCFL